MATSKVQRNITITFKITINRKLNQEIDYEDPDVDDQTAFIRKILEHSETELKKKKGPKRCTFRKVYKNEWDCICIYQADAGFPMGRLDKCRYPRNHPFGTEINSIPMYECQIKHDGNKSGIKHVILNPYAQGLTDKDKRRLGRYIDDHIEKCASPIYDEDRGAGATKTLKHIGTGNWVVYLTDRGVKYEFDNIKEPFPFKTTTGQVASITIVRKETEAQMVNRMKAAGCTEEAIETAILVRKAKEMAAEDERVKRQKERAKEEENFRKEMKEIESMAAMAKISKPVETEGANKNLAKKLKDGLESAKRLDMRHQSMVEYAKIFSEQWQIEKEDGKWRDHIEPDIRNAALSAMKNEEARYQSNTDAKIKYIKYIDANGKITAISKQVPGVPPVLGQYKPGQNLNPQNIEAPPTEIVFAEKPAEGQNDLTLAPKAGSLSFAQAAAGESGTMPPLVTNHPTTTPGGKKRPPTSRTSDSGEVDYETPNSSAASTTSTFTSALSGKSPSPKKSLLDDYSKNKAWMEQNNEAFFGYKWINPAEFYDALEQLCRQGKDYDPDVKTLEYLRATVWFLSNRPQTGPGSKNSLRKMGWPTLKRHFDEMYEIDKIKVGELSSLKQIWRSILAIQPEGNELDWPTIDSYFGAYAETALTDDMANLVSRVMASTIPNKKTPGLG